jgi:Flp pilus assembly protein TadD
MTDESTLISGPMTPRLAVKTGGRIVEQVDVRTELRLGRAEDNDLDLTDPKVSRHHARIYQEGATYLVADLGSANGTRVNGILLTGPHRLQHGDRITVGDTELIYQEPGRTSDDTLVAPSPAAPGALPTITRDRVPAMAPPPASPPRRAARRGASRGVTIALGFVGGLVIVALAVGALYLLVPGLFGQVEPTVQPTQTPQIVVATATAPLEATSAVPTVPAVVETGVAPATSVAAGAVDERLAQGETLARQSKFEDAIAAYQTLTEQEPSDARPEIGWAWALIWDERGEEALPHAQRAVALDSTNAEAAAVLARAHIETGEKDQALTEALKAVELGPGNARAHAVLADAYMTNDQISDAVDEADLALVQDINSAEAHRIRGWLYYVADNDMGRAAGELQIAAGLQPELWLRRYELGTLLLKAEDYTTAIMAFQDALGIRPKAVTYTAIGEAYFRLGQYDQARSSLQQAVLAGAQDLNTYSLLGATYARLGRCTDATPYYEQALELDAAEPLALEAKDLCEEAGPAPTPSPTTASGSVPTASSSPQPSSPKPTARPSSLPALSGRIAFPVWNRETFKYDTYVAKVDGSGWHVAIEEMHQPAFSPDGTWLAVNGEQADHMNLFIVHPDGSGLKEISENIEDALPCWSPDNKSIVFSSTKYPDRQSRLFVIDEVPFVGRREQGRTLNSGLEDVRGEYPAWTSGGQIVFKGCDTTVEPAKCGLFIMSAGPGAHPTQQLTENPEDTAPAASENRIAFTTNRDGNWEIYAINSDGSGLNRLTNNAADDGLPTWSPDGKAIAFVSNQGGAWAVWVMSPDGSNRKKLFDLGGGGLVSDWQHERISWAP